MYPLYRGIRRDCCCQQEFHGCVRQWWRWRTVQAVHRGLQGDAHWCTGAVWQKRWALLVTSWIQTVPISCINSGRMRGDIGYCSICWTLLATTTLRGRLSVDAECRDVPYIQPSERIGLCLCAIRVLSCTLRPDSEYCMCTYTQLNHSSDTCDCGEAWKWLWLCTCCSLWSSSKNVVAWCKCLMSEHHHAFTWLLPSGDTFLLDVLFIHDIDPMIFTQSHMHNSHVAISVLTPSRKDDLEFSDPL